MNPLLESISGPVAEALGWALIHSLWQGALVALILFTLLRQINGAGTRYFLAVSALALMVLLPIATAWELFQGSVGTTLEMAKTSAPALFTKEALSVAPAFVESNAPSGSFLQTARALTAANLPLVVLFWAAGVSLFSFRLLAGWLRLRSMVAENLEVPAHLRDMMNALADRLEIWQPLRMIQSRLVEVPTVIGWFEPVILLPVSVLTGLSPQQLETILAHELAHIRRHDYAVNLAQTVVETLFFYHPATWWISRQIRIERENCCDDLVVETCGNPVVYARALATLEQLRSVPSPGIAASGGSLLLRVRRLLAIPESRCSTRWVAGIPVLALAATILIAAPLTMFAFGSEAVPQPAGISITVTGEAEPAAGTFGAPDVASFPMLELHVDGDVIEEHDLLIWNDQQSVVEISDLTELFRLQDLSNGSVKIALFGIDYAGETEASFEGVEAARRFTNDELLELREYGVTSAYVASLRSVGFTELSADEVLSLFRHGVQADFIREISAAGLQTDDAEDLLALKIHGVRPELIRGLRELGYDDLDAEEFASASIHGLTPTWVKSMHEAGFSDEDFDDLVGMRIHAIKPELISEIRALDLDGMCADMIMTMAIHGVSPEFVREMAKLGYDNLEAEELVAFRIHGVSPAFIGEITNAGYPGIDADELIELRVHGINASWIRRIREAGYMDLDIDDLIELRIHGASVRSHSEH